MYLNRLPVYRQKFLILIKTDVAPIPNASRSVIEVIVIEMPLFLSMHFILSLTVDSGKDGAPAIPDIKMNMSSIPIPKMENIFSVYFPFIR